MRRTLAPVAVLVATLLLAGCGASAVPQDDVEAQVFDGLTETVGEEPDDVTCPGDLPAEVDAEMVCELTAQGDSIDVTVTVTSVDGSDVEFDFVVADQAN